MNLPELPLVNKDDLNEDSRSDDNLLEWAHGTRKSRRIRGLSPIKPFEDVKKTSDHIHNMIHELEPNPNSMKQYENNYAFNQAVLGEVLDDEVKPDHVEYGQFTPDTSDFKSAIGLF